MNKLQTRGILAAILIISVSSATFFLLPKALVQAGPDIKQLNKKTRQALNTPRGHSANLQINANFLLQSSSGRDYDGKLAAVGAFSGNDLKLSLKKNDVLQLPNSELRFVDNGIYFMLDKKWYGFNGQFFGIEAQTNQGLKNIITKTLRGLQGSVLQGPLINNKETWQINIDLANSPGLLNLLLQQTETEDHQVAKNAILSSYSFKLFIGQKDFLPYRIEARAKSNDNVLTADNEIVEAIADFDFQLQVDFYDWGSEQKIYAPRQSYNIFQLLNKYLNRFTRPVIPENPSEE